MESEKEKLEKVNRFANFATSAEPVVSITDEVYKSSKFAMGSRSKSVRILSKEEAEQIISSGGADELRELSQNFFYSSGFYRKLLVYYATILYYTPLLIPHMKGGKKKITDKKYSKKYYEALELINSLNFEQLCREFSLSVLTEGAFYGIIKEANGKFCIQKLPYEKCRSRFRSFSGVDIVEFDLSWFDSITDADLKKQTLKDYPKEFRKAYNRFKNGKTEERWYKIPSNIGFHFSLYEDRPFFGSVIPSIINFNDYIDLEKDKDTQVLKSLLVQEMPHTAAGDLIIDPEEAIEFHKGLQKIAKNNENLDAITTYGEIKLHRVQDDDATVKNNLEKIERTIYAQAGASAELFAADNNTALEKSILNDITTMMWLANQYSIWLKNFINDIFEDSNIVFGVEILPVGQYNQEKYLSQTLQAAQYGYSFMIPSLAMGLEQNQLLDMKNVEINLLDMQTVLVPLRSSHTESGNQGDKAKASATGATTEQEKEQAEKEGPSKDESEQSDKTIQNKNSSGGEA